MEVSSSVSPVSSVSSVSSLSPVSTIASNDHLNLDNLPNLVYFCLFKYLDLDDVLELKLVSKRFYFIVKSYNITDLSFLNDFDDKFYFNITIKPIVMARNLNTSKLGLLKNPDSNSFLNLKYLRIWQHESVSIKLEDISKFTKLQMLEIGRLCPMLKDTLRLPNLNALFIRFHDEHDAEGLAEIEIDTPNLYSLSIELYIHIPNGDQDDKGVIKLNHPHSVKYLQLIDYEEEKDISKFKNLENLDLCYECGYCNFDQLNDLAKLEKLKQLRIYCSPQVFTAKFKDKLKNLFREKKNDLDISLKGVKVNRVSDLDEFESCLNSSELEFQLNRYKDLEKDLHVITIISYNELISLLPDKQPSDLFSKYTNIQQIEIHSEIEDENRLINFIKGCRNLTVLDLKRSSLSQQFFDQLPAASLISYLIILNNDVDLNFKFIEKMTYLQCVFTDHDPLANANLNLNGLKYFRCFEFKINKKRLVRLIKKNKDRYWIDDCKNLDLPDQEYFSQEELIKWSKCLRDKK